MITSKYAPANVSEHDAIATVVQHYIDGAKSGKGDDMKPAFSWRPPSAHFGLQVESRP